MTVVEFHGYCPIHDALSCLQGKEKGEDMKRRKI